MNSLCGHKVAKFPCCASASTQRTKSAMRALASFLAIQNLVDSHKGFFFRQMRVSAGPFGGGWEQMLTGCERRSPNGKIFDKCEKHCLGGLRL